MQCALIAAAATYGGPAVSVGVSGACDIAGYASEIVDHDWIGLAGDVACGFFSEVFATQIGVFAAGAAAATVPGAVAIGVETYRAISATLKVVCGGLLDGGAATFGYNLEARHETNVALDIIRSGKCLRERRVFGLISWSAASC